MRRLVERVGGHGRLRGGACCPRVPGLARRRGGRQPGRSEQRGSLGAGQLHPVGVGLVGQHTGVAQHLHRRRGRGRGQDRRPLGQPSLGFGHQPGGVVQIHPDGGVSTEPVTVASTLDGPGPERHPEPADQRGYVLGGATRWEATPEAIDDAVGGDEPVPLDGQQHEEPVCLSGADPARRYPATVHAERPGQPYGDPFHPPSLGPGAQPPLCHKAQATGVVQVDDGHPPPWMCSTTLLSSRVGEKSTYSQSSSASGA